MNTVTVLITPAIAAEFLKLNTANRPLRPSWIKALSGMMQRGEWMMTHQGIAITTDGRLIDGQHRLNAVIHAGVSVNMSVVYNCDPASFIALDGGVKRSAADHLGVSKYVVSVARMLYQMPQHGFHASPTSLQISDVLDWAGPTIDEAMIYASSHDIRCSTSIRLALTVHLMARRRDVLPAYEAFRDLQFDVMTASMQALARQIIDGKTSASARPFDLAARTYRALHPENWSARNIYIRDINVPIREMMADVERFRRLQA